jgi:hypothetical protein
MKRLKKKLSCVLACCVALSNVPAGFASQTDQSVPSAATVQPAQQTPERLQQLVAPIALYPDALVAQILAGATYPDEIVEADRWMQQHGQLTGEQLAEQVDTQPWDPSVKALTEFPAVLANMDKNLSWTSSLGDAYVNQEQDVMNAVQVMRQRAQTAGHLAGDSHQKVSKQGNTIVIEPADPQVVYVPQYNPWIVYGPPLVAWPGWYGYPGLFWDGPGIGFGLGFGLGFFGGFGWGWGHWGTDWHHAAIIHNHNTYISHSRTFVNRRALAARHGNVGRVGGFDGRGAFHGGGASHGGDHTAPRSGAFGGFGHGGATRGFSSRGRSSYGGVHGGGSGGFHGGGGHGGGGRR